MPTYRVFTKQRTYREYLLEAPNEDAIQLSGKPVETFVTDEMINEIRVDQPKEPEAGPESHRSVPEGDKP